MEAARALVARYYASFDAGDIEGMLDCLSDDVAHHVNEGAIRVGKPAFAAFCAHMNRCYRERLTDIVVMASPDGARAAAEFTRERNLPGDRRGPARGVRADLCPARRRLFQHRGRANFARRDLLQPRRLGAAGLGVSLIFREYLGEGIAGVLDDLARLRVSVFRDWPYLYDGDAEYERGYLARYARGDSIVVAAYAGEEMVGAATGMPLADHADDFAAAFRGDGHRHEGRLLLR